MTQATIHVAGGGAVHAVRSAMDLSAGKSDHPFRGKRVYMIGIGGSGMSGLARLLRAQGAEVAGSDREPSELTASLAESGIGVTYEQDLGELPACDLVVTSAAVGPTHPQVSTARARGVEVWLYARALGETMTGTLGVAVAGTHGKSTTTTMLGCALADSGLDPTVIVGATSGQLRHGCLGPATPPAGFRIGAGPVVVEACEYNRSFHSLRPRVACITNVEADHLDCYGTFDGVIESFRQFAALLPSAAEGGLLVIGHENAQRGVVTAGLACDVRTVGFSPDADWCVRYDPGTRAVGLSRDGRERAAWTLRVPGAHNAINSATAWIMADALGASGERVAASLAEFRGADRRMQLLGELAVSGGVVRVIDDYGHHPTEVEVTLRALREAERPQTRGGRLICVFQPHQHSRTRHLLDQFALSFGEADVVLVPPIYFVRDSERERDLVSSEDLVSRLREKGVEAHAAAGFEEIIARLSGMVRGGDVVVVMGAGPVWKVGRGLLAAGSRKG
ncbi:MAG: UDP-N-acetylmuramate--L-alanine ligase [Leptolyngbya sp. PLA1]|nr:UDP-N-acetylmuramate--L-alanine ligase [Leptolyngbya sp. PLA1]